MGVVPKLAISRKVLQILYEKIRKNCHFTKKKINSTKNQKIILKRKDQKNCNFTEKSIQTIFSILPKKNLVKLTNYTKILLFDGKILKIDTFSVRKNVFLLGFDLLHAVAVNFGDFFQNFVGHDEFADLI